MNLAFYAPEMNMQALDRLTLESDLHRAIERNELFLMYQPQLSLRTGDVLGLEALVNRTGIPGGSKP